MKFQLSLAFLIYIKVWHINILIIELVNKTIGKLFLLVLNLDTKNTDNKPKENVTSEEMEVIEVKIKSKEDNEDDSGIFSHRDDKPRGFLITDSMCKDFKFFSQTVCVNILYFYATGAFHRQRTVIFLPLKLTNK